MSRFRDKNATNNSKALNSKYIINDRIKADYVTVIDQEGRNLGSIPKSEALALAEEAGLDLVQVGEKDSGVITKILDFGKHLYTKKKQQSEAKKKQKVIQVKEVKLRPNIGDGDYKTKINRAIKFLTEGKKVKFTLQFRGRELIMVRELGANFFNRIHDDLTNSNIPGTLIQEKEQRSGHFWFRIYYIK